MITSLLELATTKYWMAHPPHFNALRNIVQDNVAGRVVLSADSISKHDPYMASLSAEGSVIRMGDDDREGREIDKESTEFVVILPVTGPVTRNGNACTYGSVELRDKVLHYAGKDECRGFIFYVDTCGGSASAIPDFKYAIDYAHSCGKKVIAFVDGCALSAGIYLCALCDEVYYMNDKDQLGSIGVMAAFYTTKSGEANAYTNETYHEIYADASYQKNLWHREAAEGEYDSLKADLNILADEFMSDVKAHRPNVTDEYLHGDIFDASAVEGILADGKSTLDECVQRLIAPSEDMETSAGNEEGKPMGEEKSEAGCKPKTEQESDTNINNISSMATYTLITEACGLESEQLQVQAEGAFLNTPLLQHLEAHLGNQAKQMADMREEMTKGSQSMAALQEQLDSKESCIATLTTERDNAVSELSTAKDAHANALEQLNSEIESLKAEKAQLEAELQSAKESARSAEQSLADRDAQIEELTSEPSEEPQAGAAPASNGEGLQTRTMRSFDPTPYKTLAERKAAFIAFTEGK